MPSTFDRKTSRNIGTTPVAVGDYTVPLGTTSTVIGLLISNVHSSSEITVDAYLFDGTNSTYLFKNSKIIVGQAMIPIGGEQKVVMKAGDSIRIVSNMASSVDAILSVLEQS